MPQSKEEQTESVMPSYSRVLETVPHVVRRGVEKLMRLQHLWDGQDINNIAGCIVSHLFEAA